MVLKIVCSIFIISIQRNLKKSLAYFTQIIHYAFLRRIQREKRQLEIKNKILEKSGYSEVFDDNNTLDGSNYSDYNSIKDAVHSKLFLISVELFTMKVTIQDKNLLLIILKIIKIIKIDILVLVPSQEFTYLKDTILDIVHKSFLSWLIFYKKEILRRFMIMNQLSLLFIF